MKKKKMKEKEFNYEYLRFTLDELKTHTEIMKKKRGQSREAITRTIVGELCMPHTRAVLFPSNTPVQPQYDACTAVSVTSGPCQHPT